MSVEALTVLTFVVVTVVVGSIFAVARGLARLVTPRHRAHADGPAQETGAPSHGQRGPGPEGADQRNHRSGPVGGDAQPRIDLSGRGNYWFDIVGESSYQGTLRRIAGRRLEEGEEIIVPCLVAVEPDNPRDPGAVAVYVDGYGKVGYFSHDDLAGRFGELQEHLAATGLVGTCTGRLTGGWEEEISIGVRLNLVRPSAFARAQGRRAADEPSGGTAPDEPPVVLPDGWMDRARVSLAVGKAWLNLVDERLCQDELRRLAEGRDLTRETVGFDAQLVADGTGSVLVCTAEGAVVGRMGKSDVARYSDVFAALGPEKVGVCGGWVIQEGEQVGARISMKAPKALLKDLDAAGRT